MATAAQILAAIQPYLTESNKINPGNPMQTSYGAGEVYIYLLPTNPPAIVYTTSAAVDCDGQPNSLCATDPTNQSDTSCHQSDGLALDPVSLPWYVIPESPNPFFDYTNYNISCGQVGLCLYGNNMQYGVFGDERGRDVGNASGIMIGEVSYAMAAALGINPNPSIGGVEDGVTYIIFTGGSNIANPIENPSSSVSIGTSALNTMLSQLSGGGGCSPPCPQGYICQGTTCVPIGGGGGACAADQFNIFGKCVAKSTVYVGLAGVAAIAAVAFSRRNQQSAVRNRIRH